MRIRSLTLEDLDLFVEAAGFPDHRKEVEQYLKSMFAAGSMRPEWCFVAEDERDRRVGRVAFWTLPGTEAPFALVLLDVDWGVDHAGTGERLLEDALLRARDLGAVEIEHVIDDPPMRPQFQHHAEKRIELLQNSGFVLRRETSRFEWRGGELAVEPVRLTFRTLAEVGEKTFVEAMKNVSEGTLDREIGGERQRLGAQRAAQEFFEDAERVQHEPPWWRLAYAPDGELVGLVMPAQPPGFLTLFYVGVVPEMRGKGYVDDLLVVGTATLLEARGEKHKPLIADTDVANSPMAAAFERAGWTRFAGRREYVVSMPVNPVRHAGSRTTGWA
jgi:GNAT superfamily N-acetyltransferase/ribosomal protein S18 acetylase RimI-like enzyme